jgi:hypothetical protein
LIALVVQALSPSTMRSCNIAGNVHTITTSYVTGPLPEGQLGDVAEAEINKESGCIIRISHGQ